MTEKQLQDAFAAGAQESMGQMARILRDGLDEDDPVPCVVDCSHSYCLVMSGLSCARALYLTW